MAQSKIEWTESTWNPVTGCDKVSPGCKNCYAERMAKRLKAMGQANYANGFKLSLHEKSIELPLSWKRPQTIFVNSMSDLFHKEVPDDFILKMFRVMNEAYWHNFQILTKRSERLKEINRLVTWTENIWMGVSVENDDYKCRIDDLRKMDAVIKFLSLEPLIGEITNIDLTNIDWVIAGGESGPKSRPVNPGWITGIRDQCVKAGVPFFFKQWGGKNKKKAGNILEGRQWLQMPRIKKAG